MLNIFLSLYFIGILSSISIMDFASTLLIGWLGWKVFKDKGFKIKPPPNGISLALVVWMMVILLSLLINQVPFKEGLVDIYRFKWLLSYAVSYIIFSYWTFNKKTYLFLFSTILIAMLYAISVTVFGHDYIRPTKAIPIAFLGGLRTAGFLGNAMTFAQSMGIVFCFLTSLLLTYFYQNWKMKLADQKLSSQELSNKFFDLSHPVQLSFLQSRWLKVVIAVTWIALLFSFTRSVWLSATVAVSLISFITRPRFGLIAGILLVGSAALVILSSQGAKERIVNLSSPQNESNSDRLLLWKTNLQIFKESPVIGIGFGQNIRRLPNYYEKLGVPADAFKADAHNQYINALAGTGILGLLCYLSFLSLIFKQAWQLFLKGKDHLNRDPERGFLPMALGLTVMGALIHLFVAGFFECNFEDSSTLHCFFFFVGWMLATAQNPPDLQNQLVQNV